MRKNKLTWNGNFIQKLKKRKSETAEIAKIIGESSQPIRSKFENQNTL